MDSSSRINCSSYVWPPQYYINRKASLSDIFNEYYNLLDRKHLKTLIDLCDGGDQCKDYEASESYFSSSVYCQEVGFYIQALYYINGAIIFAPVQHKIYGLALEFRSEILFALEKYVECLQDIDQIPSTKCPKGHFYKIFIRKCCCFRNLRQYKEAWRTLEEAKLAFECTTEISTDIRKDIRRKLTWLEKDLRHILESNPKDHSAPSPNTEATQIPYLLNGENEQFVGASNSVHLLQNNRSGRSVIAKEPIKKGSVLFVEEPYAISNTFINNHMLYHCSTCLKTIVAITPCSGCLHVYYCCINCKEIHWNLRHRWECAGMRKDILSPTMQLALGILFRASFSNFNQTLTDNVFGNKVDNYAYIQTLETNHDKIPKKFMKLILKQSCWIVIYLKYCTNYFFWLRSQYPNDWKSSKLATQNVGLYLFKHLLQIYYHSEMIGDFYPGSSDNFFQGYYYMRKTLALYVSSRLIKHSCLPNTVASFEGPTKIIRASRDINAGEMITISYFDKSMTTGIFELAFANQIRQAFMKRYLIICKCIYCTEDSLSRVMYCYKCSYCSHFASRLDNGNAICLNCEKEFSLSQYEEKQSLLNTTNASMVNKKTSIQDLDELYNQMKNIFHSFNLNFVYLYAHYAYFYESKENYLKVAEYVDKIAFIRKTWFGESDEIYAGYMVCYTVSYVKHFLSVRNIDVYDRKIEKPLKKKVRQALQKTISILENHMSKEIINAFEKIVIDILESRKFIFPYQVENMIFYYTSKTPVLIKLYDTVRISDSI